MNKEWERVKRELEKDEAATQKLMFAERVGRRAGIRAAAELIEHEQHALPVREADYSRFLVRKLYELAEKTESMDTESK
jgi:hypothetical protein